MANDTKTKNTRQLKDNHFVWALLSLIAALFIWVYYTSNYAEEQERVFYGVEVVYTGADAMRDSLSLIISEADTTTVNVTLRGSRRDLQRLSSESLRAVVNLSTVTREGFRTMGYSLSYPTNVNSAGITVVRQSPSTVGLQVSKLSTKVVDVSGSFAGSAAEGYVVDASEMTFDPASVTVTGPEEELEQIATARVTVARDEVRSSFNAAANYVFLNADGEELELSDVQADIDTVSVTVPISAIKEIGVDVTLLYGGSAQENNVKKDVQPKTITVAGDAAILDGLNSVSVATIDLSDFETFPTTDYSIILPNGVECLSGETTATVSISFIGLSTSYFNVSNLSCANVPDHFDATIMEQTSVVNVRAPADILNQVSANNIRVVADLTDVTAVPGTAITVRAPAAVYIDGFDNAGAVGDYTLFVRLEESGGKPETPQIPEGSGVSESTDVVVDPGPASRPDSVNVPEGGQG